MIPALLTVFLVGLIAGLVSSLAVHWGLSRRCYSLECDMADLQEKVLSEIKKRAAKMAKHDPLADQILEKIQQPPPEPPEPWWMKYAAQRVKG